MTLYKKQLGKTGGIIAVNYYQKLGYKIIIRNFYTRYGELDLVLRKNNKILVVEVKTRTNNKFGYGEETISTKKLKNIHISYQILCQQKQLPDSVEIEVCVIYMCYNTYTINRFII